MVITVVKLTLHTHSLPYSPPYDWEAVLAFRRAHQLPYLESVDDSGYERIFRAEQQLGWFRVEHQRNQNALLLSVWDNSKENVVKISKSVRGMFDLDTDPSTLLTSMSPDSFLSSFWAQLLAFVWRDLGALTSRYLRRCLRLSLERTSASLPRKPMRVKELPS